MDEACPYCGYRMSGAEALHLTMAGAYAASQGKDMVILPHACAGQARAVFENLPERLADLPT